MQMYSEKDVDSSILMGKKIAILGYGSQGRAHALNLKDSGHNVVVGLRKNGPSWTKAIADGLDVEEPNVAVIDAAITAFLTPDLTQEQLYADIEDSLNQKSAILFAHGFNIHYKQIKPREDLDVFLIAPKGPGGLVRRQYQEGHGVPCLVAVEADQTGAALSLALGYAHGIGGARAGVIETTFAEETETDLFGEQAVLCGGATELVVAGYETLTAAGYQPEVAYYECMHELKLIVDLLHEGGLKKMHEFISDTAAYGDLVSGPRVIDEHVRKKMKDVLNDIQDGTFANNWINENKNGQPEFKKMMDADLNHSIEEVGSDLRGRMDWLEN
jgi:ketol-acid reductoisomerase